MNRTANRPTTKPKTKTAPPSGAPREAPVSFAPHRFREQEYELQRAGKCIGHVWKWGKTWSIRLGDYFSTASTLRNAKATVRAITERN